MKSKTSNTTETGNNANLLLPAVFLKCMCCGLQDETVKDLGWKLCPKCDDKLAKSIDAVEKHRHLNPEFDGGGAS